MAVAADPTSVFADLAPDQPGCAVGVWKDGSRVHTSGHGVRQIDGVPLDENTAFRIASTSKQFTAASILLLAADGKLDLNDPVHRWVPSLNSEATLRQLLHHTSGHRDYLVIMALAGVEEPYTSQDVIRMLGRQQSGAFEPGEKHVYSNSGYLVLAEVVKAASGSTLDEFAKERIFGPLEMHHTHFAVDPKRRWPERATGHTFNPNGESRVEETESAIIGDGAVITTLADLDGWVEHLRTDTLGIRDAQWTRGSLTDGTVIDYAAGLQHGVLDGHRSISHSGSYAGFEADLLHIPEHALSVAVLCNVEGETPSKRATDTARLYLPTAPEEEDTAPVASPSVALPLSASQAKAFLGVFTLTPQLAVTFTHNGDTLSGQATGQGSFPLSYEGERRFHFAPADIHIKFSAPSDGQSMQLDFQQGAAHLTAERRMEGGWTDLTSRSGMYRLDELDVDAKLKIRGDQAKLKLPIGKLTFQRTGAHTFTQPEIGLGLRILADSIILDAPRAEGLRLTRP